MIQPDNLVDSVIAKRNRMGGKFSLASAFAAIECVYAERELADDDLEPSLVLVAGKFDDEDRRRFDVGIYPSYSFYQPIEILFTYPRNWRSWSLAKFDSKIIEFSADDGITLDDTYNSRWFRLYRNVKPTEFVCRMRTAEELEALATSMSNFMVNGL